MDAPDQLRAERSDMEDDWCLISCLLGGTSEMREARTKYLPQFPAETRVFYEDRLSRSTLFNGFRRTVDTMSGKPFTEPVKLGNDMPPEIQAYCKDIDLEGRSLDSFSHEVFWYAEAFGLSHVLVDYPETEQALSLAEQKQRGIRPYFVHIKPKQILGWRSERVSGVEALTQLRIMECVAVDDGQFGVKTIDQVRVLWPDRFAIYRKDDKNNWGVFEEGPVSLGVIPLATVYTGRTGFMTAKSPLLDLAYLNVEHWQKASDLSNILHVASVPILFGAGFKNEEEGEGEVAISVQKAITTADPGADLKYVEHSGAAIGAGRQELQDIEDRMRVLGANLLVRNNAGNRTTATEKSIDSAEADSALAQHALNLQGGLIQAFSFMAKWEKRPTGGSVEIYRDFDDVVNDAARGDALTKARDSKNGPVVSRQTAFEALQEMGVLPESLTWEEERARLASEGPPPAASPQGTTINLSSSNVKQIKKLPDGSWDLGDGRKAVKTDTGYAIAEGV